MMGTSVLHVPRLVRMLIGFQQLSTMEIHRVLGASCRWRAERGFPDVSSWALPGVHSRPVFGRDVMVQVNTEGTRGKDIFRHRRSEFTSMA